MQQRISIQQTNGDLVEWNQDKWDDYEYRGSEFIIKRDGAWVGIYNMKFVMDIVVEDIKDEDN